MTVRLAGPLPVTRLILSPTSMPFLWAKPTSRMAVAEISPEKDSPAITSGLFIPGPFSASIPIRTAGADSFWPSPVA